VQPDVVVEVAEGTPPDRDLYLERAVEILAGQAVGEETGEGPAADAAARPSGLSPALSPTSYDPSGQLAAIA